MSGCSMIQPVYEEVRAAIEAAGFFAFGAKVGKDGHRLLCAAQRMPDGRGFAGNSFWVAERAGTWYAGHWSGRLYRFAAASEVAPFCIAWMSRLADQFGPDFDQDLKERHQLTPIGEEEVAGARL